MIKNILYFTTLNIAFWAALFLISEAFIFFGPFSATMLAAVGLSRRLMRQTLPSLPIRIFLALICISISTAITAGLFCWLVDDPHYTLGKMSFLIFILSMIAAPVILFPQREGSADPFQQRISRSPILKRINKFFEEKGIQRIVNMSNEELVRNATMLSGLVAVMIAIFTATITGIVWMILNDSFVDYPIPFFLSALLVILLIHLFWIEKSVIRNELSRRLSQ